MVYFYQLKKVGCVHNEISIQQTVLQKLNALYSLLIPTVNFRFKSVAEGSSSAQKRAFKDTSLLFLIYLHRCVVELLYKPNITLVDVRYGCISHCSAYIRITAVRYTA